MRSIKVALIVSLISVLPVFIYGEEEIMKITSPAFENGKFIPKEYSCQGVGSNPQLLIEGVPAAAKSLVLIVDDPDAPMGTFVHWVVYDIPVVSQIAQDSVPGTQGVNTARQQAYVSPCPPSGVHRYFFRLYALDTELGLAPGAGRAKVEAAMQGHILATAELMGLYKKTGTR
jgi:Raf kinase inhibitor-like YbhB/YbcL family protein